MVLCPSRHDRRHSTGPNALQQIQRLSLLPTSLLALLAVSTSPSRASSVVDFGYYPTASQACLYQASNSSGCNGNTVSAENSCLCNNGGDFVFNAASCLGQSDPSDLLDVYQTMSASCSDSSTPLNVPESQFLSAASYTSTTSSPSTTSQSSSTNESFKSSTTTASSETPRSTVSAQIASPTASAGGDDRNNNQGGNSEEEGSGGKGKLSEGARAGVISASVISGLAMFGTLIYYVLRYRRKRSGEESRPMLPYEFGSVSGPGAEVNALPTSAEVLALDLAGDHGTGGEWPYEGKWRPSHSPDIQPSKASSFNFNWESPYETGWGANRPGSQRTEHWARPPPSSRSVLSNPSYVSTPSNVVSNVGERVYELAGSDLGEAPIELMGSLGSPNGGQDYSGTGWGPAPAAEGRAYSPNLDDGLRPDLAASVTYHSWLKT